MASDHVVYVGAGYQEKVIKRFLLKTSRTLDIATWSIRNFKVKIRNDFFTISELLRDLVFKKGVEARLIIGNSKDLDLVKKHFIPAGVNVKILPKNHAKIIIMDDILAYMGSANFTGGGVGSTLKSKKKFFNLEVAMLTWAKDDLKKLKYYFETCWKHATRLT